MIREGKRVSGRRVPRRAGRLRPPNALVIVTVPVLVGSWSAAGYALGGWPGVAVGAVLGSGVSVALALLVDRWKV